MNPAVRQCDLATAYRAYQGIPEFDQREGYEAIHERVGDDYLALVCEVDAEPVGFKLGYPLSADTFYSWLGGVHPAHRGSGIARALLLAQEEHCRRAGYQLLRVKSKNRFPAMLQMLVSQGYQIDGYTPGELAADNKIHFVKAL